jgi:hypothetical protein
MALWVPVLRKNDVGELLRKLVDDWDNLVSVGDGESAAGAEIVLNVNDQQDIMARSFE